MVEIHMIGDRVVFYAYRIDCAVPEAPPPPARELKEKTEEGEELVPAAPSLEETDWGKFHDRFARYRIESYGLYAENDEELNDIKAGLEEFGIAYTVTDIRPTDEQAARAEEVEGWTGSLKEALNYIVDGVLPKRMAEEKRLKDLEQKVKALEKKPKKEK